MRDGAPRIGRPRRYNILINEKTTEIQVGDDSHLIALAQSWQGEHPGEPRRHPARREPRLPGITKRRLDKSLSNASRGARRLEDLLKNCHLLPSAAILEPQNR
jgi:hypothetical protein